MKINFNDWDEINNDLTDLFNKFLNQTEFIYDEYGLINIKSNKKILDELIKYSKLTSSTNITDDIFYIYLIKKNNNFYKLYPFKYTYRVYKTIDLINFI